MKGLLVLFVIGFLFPVNRGFAQVGEHVSTVKILNMAKDTVNLPLLGEKNLLIFYADPARPGQNKDFRNYLKTHPVMNPQVASFGIINLAAAPLIPNSLIVRKAKKEIAGTDAQLYLDPDNILSTAWKLPGADNNFTVIFVNKNKVIEFYKAGQLTQDEKEKVLALIRKSGE